MSRAGGRTRRGRPRGAALLALLLTLAAGHAAVAQRHPIVWIPDAARDDPGEDAAASLLRPLGVSVGGRLDDAAPGALRPGEVYLFHALSAPGPTVEELFARLRERLLLLAELYPGYDPPYLVGPGYGGLLAAAFAAREPTLVEGAIAIGSPLSEGVADSATRLGLALAGEGATSEDRELLDSWMEFARRHRALIRDAFSTRPPPDQEAAQAAYGLVRGAWGWSDETLSWLAALERGLTGTVPARGSIVPLPVLPSEPPVDPVARLMVLAAEALSASPAARTLRPAAALTERANGLLSFSAQLPAGWAADGESVNAQIGFAPEGTRTLEVALPSGDRRARLPALADPFQDASGLRSALSSLGWSPWSATFRDAAVDIVVCEEAAEEAFDVAATLALALHPSSPVHTRSCTAGGSEVWVSSLAELAGLDHGPDSPAARAASGTLPDLVIADRLDQAAGADLDLSTAGGLLMRSRASAEPPPTGWTLLQERDPLRRAVELIQRFPAWEVLALEAGGSRALRVPVDGTVRDLLLLGFGGDAQLFLDQRDLTAEGSRLALERLGIRAVHLEQVDPGWLEIEPSRADSGGTPGAVVARTSVTTSLELSRSGGGVAATACLRAADGRPELDSSSVWLEDGDRSYPLSFLVADDCLEVRGRRFEPSRQGRLNVRLAGTTPGGLPFRRIRSAVVPASGRGTPRHRPVDLALAGPATAPLPPARPPLAAVVIETIEEHLLIFDEGRASAVLEPYRDRRVVVALDSDPESWSIGRYFHQVLSLDLLEMNRQDPILSRLRDGTVIRLYDQQDHLWNREYAWPTGE